MLKTNDLLRAQYVKRWHIVATIREQSLAEHTFNVIVIARAIAKECDVDDREIIKAAFLHDLDEIVTGDIPTATKVRARKNGWELNDLYKRVVDRELTDIEEKIVKLADIREAVWFLTDNVHTGHGTEVFKYVRHMWNEEMRKLAASNVKWKNELYNAALKVDEAISDWRYTI